MAQEYGARSLAVRALNHLFDLATKTGQLDLNLPFLAPGSRFDSVDPRRALGPWMLAAMLEELERLASFSSCYSGSSDLPRLLRTRYLGYGSAEMVRRLGLVQRRFGSSAKAGG